MRTYAKQFTFNSPNLCKPLSIKELHKIIISTDFVLDFLKRTIILLLYNILTGEEIELYNYNDNDVLDGYFKRNQLSELP